jgi:hypothetical protein
MRDGAIGNGAVTGPAKALPAPEIIPTTDELGYGETVYFKLGGAEAWLSGGRGANNTDVLTRDGEGGALEANYRWTLMLSPSAPGTGPVRYGDTVYLRLGATDRWLSGGRGDAQEDVSSRPFDAGAVDSFRWTVMQSRSSTGTGAVKRGSAVYLKVGGKKDRWLSGGRGNHQEGVVTRDGEGGTLEANYQWSSGPVSYSRAFAVFAEYALVEKPMLEGMNVRVFNRVEARSPDGGIALDARTGIITLPPGTYHLTGFSTTAYRTELEHPGMVRTKELANGGYCRLRHDVLATSLEGSIAIGGISTANAIPSVIEGWLSTTVEARILLEHQSGDQVEDVILQSEPGDYHGRVFARLAIERLP